jgi:hypothetical protein
MGSSYLDPPEPASTSLEARKRVARSRPNRHESMIPRDRQNRPRFLIEEALALNEKASLMALRIPFLRCLDV